MPGPRWEETRRRVALTGRVTEAETGHPVAGACVAISSAPAKVATAHAAAPHKATTASGPDGHFHFLDLPSGSYAVTASVPGRGGRYGTASARARVTVSRDGTVTAGKLELAIPATCIVGVVRAPDGMPVPFAEVSLAGGEGDRTQTDSEGRFALRGVERGDRRLAVSARGFRRETADVRVTRPGAAKTANVKLTPG